MTAIEIARQMAELGLKKDAVGAYTLAIHEGQGKDPAIDMEAALYILQNGGDYKVSYSTFVKLHKQGAFQDDCLSIMTHAFYEPNVKLLKTRYETNCKLLAKYPYLFRKDFIEFEFLPIRFYPFDDNRFTQYLAQEGKFGDFVDLKKPVISRNFFHDLENPILAKDVYSQYELEYLNDNVRPSEYVAKENHIYLHYSDWAEFCSYLQCLNLRPLLESKKFVFLIEDEVSQYPIDFKERFGIDYSSNPLKPVGIREINRLIWHSQLSSHNGGDFFNEVFDAHPNLLAISSVMFSDLQETVKQIEKVLSDSGSTREAIQRLPGWNPRLIEELYLLYDRDEKDILVTYYFQFSQDFEKQNGPYLDKESRIAPAVFFQPHFPNMIYTLHVDQGGRTMLDAEQYEAVRSSPLFLNFKYIKTFTPMRRLTTSYSATVRFMRAQLDWEMTKDEEERKNLILPDVVSERILNRSFMIDWQDRLYTDSILVRFEDGKLNPKATFTALAAFLDLPYTESMTECTEGGKEAYTPGNVKGFDPASVYKTYDDYGNKQEWIYVEYLLRDAYEAYGYDFHYYDGKPMDEERIKELVEGFSCLNGHMSAAWRNMYKGTVKIDGSVPEVEMEEEILNQIIADKVRSTNENRILNATVLMRGLYFINRRGQPLHMMPMLELDPALLEQPLYH